MLCIFACTDGCSSNESCGWCCSLCLSLSRCSLASLCSSVSAAILSLLLARILCSLASLCSSVSDICLSLICCKAAASFFRSLSSYPSWPCLSFFTFSIFLPFVLLSLKHEELSLFLFYGEACWLWYLQIQKIVLRSNPLIQKIALRLNPYYKPIKLDCVGLAQARPN